MKQEDIEMKKISKDDPRFTAKAIGEQSEELENLEIDSKDRDAFEELEAFAKSLETEFQEERDFLDELASEQLAALKTAVSDKGSNEKRKLIVIPAWTYGLAACLAIGAFSIVVLDRQTTEIATLPPTPEEASTLRSKDDADMASGDRRLRQDGQFGGASVGRGQAEQSKSFQLGELANRITLADSPTPIPMRENRLREAEQDLATANEAFRARGANEPAAQVVTADLEVKETLAQSGENYPRVARSEPNKPEEFFERSPFSMDAADDAGYRPASSLGGARLTSPRADSLSSGVVSSERVEDAGGTAQKRRSYFNEPSRAVPPAPQPSPVDREGYDHIEENEFKGVLDNPLSTFSIDVDTASYSNIRRMIESGQRPVADAVRIEELINYFKYDYPQPEGETPFSVNVEAAKAPWSEVNQLVRIGLKGKEIPDEARPDANLVFLVDVSGSMGQPNKLPLAQESMKLLVDRMGVDDRIAIVVYAGSSGLALPSTTTNNKETIRHAIDNLRSGGSTIGGAGIELAYKVATEKFIEGGINRVILCTDGDFNVGVTDDGSLTRLIEEKAKSGVFFSAIGFGRGNYQDGKMEQLSNKGNGNYAYIDGKQEARKVFVDEMLGTLHTIAKDVKIQVDFNPAQVKAYRLIGYVNRKLAKEDFNDDTKDAGEIGAGHSVTALYEIVPANADFEIPSVDASKYVDQPDRSEASKEWLTVKLRYKAPDRDTSRLIEEPFTGEIDRAFDAASADFRFVSSVAGFGMLLRDSAYKGSITNDRVLEIAGNAKGRDVNSLRSQFIELVRKAKNLPGSE